MPTHIHLVFRIISELTPQQVIGDLKRYTSKAIVKAIRENPQESRKEFLLERFANAAKNSSNVRDYKFWQHENHPIELWSPKVTNEKINYIHNNPVEAGLVHIPEKYAYSSAKDYSGEKGLVNNVIVVI